MSAYRFDRTGEGARRLVYSYVYNHLVQAMFGLRLRDMNFAFKLVRRSVFEHVELQQRGVVHRRRAARPGPAAGLPDRAVRCRLLPSHPGHLDPLLQRGDRHHHQGDARAAHRPPGSRAAPRRRARAPGEPERRAGPAHDRGGGRRALLVVNADDYGLTEGISEAILHAHRDGIVTSTSVLALSPGFTTSVRWLDDAPDLGRGAHLAAVGEDPPLLSAREVPTLVDKRGRMWPSWRVFLPRAAAGRIDPDDLRREFAAQIEAITSAGVELDHLDTHQNIHLWPMVSDVVLDLGEEHGVRTMRVTRSAERGPVGVTVRRLAVRLEGQLRAAGLALAEASTGLDEAGRLEMGAMVGGLPASPGRVPGPPSWPPTPVVPDDADRSATGGPTGGRTSTPRSDPRPSAPLSPSSASSWGPSQTCSRSPCEAPSLARRPPRPRPVGRCPRGDRFHTAVRWWTAPFAALEREVPLAGDILEVGCGHGVFSTYMAITSAPATWSVSTSTPHKIALAKGRRQPRSGRGRRLVPRVALGEVPASTGMAGHRLRRRAVPAHRGPPRRPARRVRRRPGARGAAGGEGGRHRAGREGQVAQFQEVLATRVRAHHRRRSLDFRSARELAGGARRPVCRPAPPGSITGICIRTASWSGTARARSRPYPAAAESVRRRAGAEAIEAERSSAGVGRLACWRLTAGGRRTGP